MATKPDVIAQLQAAGIAFDETASKADLEALLPDDLRALDEASDAADDAAQAPTDTAPDQTPTEPVAPVEPAQTPETNDGLPTTQDAPVEDNIAVSDITDGQPGDNPEQTRLRGVFKAYFEQNPERSAWIATKEDMLVQISRAGEVTG